MIGRDAEAGHEHRRIGELVCSLGTDEQGRGGAVGLGATVEEVQRMTHRCRREHVFDRHFVLEMRVRVARVVPL